MAICKSSYGTIAMASSNSKNAVVENEIKFISCYQSSATKQLFTYNVSKAMVGGILVAAKK